MIVFHNLYMATFVKQDDMQKFKVAAIISLYRGEFTMRAFGGGSLFGYLSLFVMCKAWHQYNERPRAFAMLNLPLFHSSSEGSLFQIIVIVLKFRTLAASQRGLDKQGRPRSDCFFRSSLIRVFPVCYSDKHTVNSSPDY